MNHKYEIRQIQDSDCAAALEIYRPFVLHTAITFEYEVPTLAQFAEKIKTITADYPWLVCLEDDKMIGYAYGSRHRYRTAYNWSPESTIYVSEAAQGKGVGKALYSTLFALLKMQGYYNVFAGVGLPNEKSERIHRAMGFEEIGDFKKVGYKLGKWHDTRWFRLVLQPHIKEPPLPLPLEKIVGGPEWKAIFAKAHEALNQ